MKIALFGKIRSGKNTVGDILTAEYDCKQFAFGTGIANIIQEYFPEAWAGGKPRKHYQHIGQQLRVLNPNVWINYLLHDVNRHICNCTKLYSGTLLKRPEINIVVTDGRQLNEAVRLKEEGFLIVKVTTPDEIRIARMKEKGDVFTPEALNHETELQVDLITPDIEIINDGTLDELKDKIQKIVQEVESVG